MPQAPGFEIDQSISISSRFLSASAATTIHGGSRPANAPPLAAQFPRHHHLIAGKINLKLSTGDSGELSFSALA
jgi:hypothetical protein